MGGKTGITFALPEEVVGKTLSTIDVGPFGENGLAREINTFLGTGIQEMVRVNTYLLVHAPNAPPLETLLNGKPFVDPILHRATLNQPLALEIGIPFDYVLQSMLKPGTSDAEGDVALRQAMLALGVPMRPGDIGFSVQQRFLTGALSMPELRAVADFLANANLYTTLIAPRAEYGQGKTVPVPVVLLPAEVKVERYDVANMGDEELLQLNAERKLAASLDELHHFRTLYRDSAFMAKRREVGLDARATDVEIETWFGLRSEHCFHKEFNARITLDDRVGDPVFQRAAERGWLQRDAAGTLILEEGLFRKFIVEPAETIQRKLQQRGKNWLARMFTDNAGTALYDENFAFCIKVETHNSPSNKEPHQGAKTGLDGIFRDIMGNELGTFDILMGGFLYCTGDPHYQGWLPSGVKHPYVLLKGVTRGVREAGNEMQVPTLAGATIIDPRYMAKCLVYCKATGWSPVQSPEGKSYLGKTPAVGDIVFVAGQPVGIDGVHGATESSLSASAKISLEHVQADFSFIQAKVRDYLIEIARRNLLTAITDLGGMGLGSASHELARLTNGLALDLSLHPTKFNGIQPWQVNCSETQDRMLLVAKPEQRGELLRCAALHDVEVTALGTFTDSGYIHLTHGRETVAYLPIERLFGREPRKQMHATWTGAPAYAAPSGQARSLEDSLCLVMARPDVASKEWFFRQKDSSVKGSTILGPLLGVKQEISADATVQKPLDTEGRDWGALAYAMGAAPKLADIDPYLAVQQSFLDTVGKIIAVGGALPDLTQPKWDAWGVCGNYCQPNSDSETTLTRESGERNLAALLREAIGVREVEEQLSIPVISGKDSMKCSCVYEVDGQFTLEDVPRDLRRHTTLVERDGKRYIEIHDPPTYLASTAVKIQDYRKCVDAALKEEGDLIYLIGTTRDDLGASPYLEAVGYAEDGAPKQGGNAHPADLQAFQATAQKISAAIDAELVASASYLHHSAGGIIGALAKACWAGERGAELQVQAIPTDAHGRSDEEILYSTTAGRFLVTISPHDRERFEELVASVPHARIGAVTASSMQVTRQDGSREILDLERVKQHYRAPLAFGDGVA